MAKFNSDAVTDGLAGSDFRNGNPTKPSGITIKFKHVATGQIAEFKAFITDFNDSFSSEWNGQDIWGRMDEIKTFKNTKRVITVSWTTPSHSREEAISNFDEISKMTAMLYPVYEDLKNEPGMSNALITQDLEQIKKQLETENKDTSNFQPQIDRIHDFILSSNDENSKTPKVKENISLISAPPIFQIKFMNWISDGQDDGLYGTLDGFVSNPVLEEGVFTVNGDLIPMTFDCSVTFTVIHTDKLGWNRDRKQRSLTFPYQTNKVRR